MIEIQIALIAVHEIEDERIFVIGLRDQIGAIGIDRLECEHRDIVVELCIGEDMLRKDIIGEEEHIVGGFFGEAHLQGGVHVFGDGDVIVLVE